MIKHFKAKTSLETMCVNKQFEICNFLGLLLRIYVFQKYVFLLPKIAFWALFCLLQNDYGFFETIYHM